MAFTADMIEHTDRRVPTERSLGLSVGLVCTLAGTLSRWRGHDVFGPTLIAAGTILLILGVAAPRVLRVPNRVWWRFAQTLGWINARVLLTAFFVIVLTPVGVIMRLCGRNPLRPSQSATTWSTYGARRRAPRHYERMF